MRRLASRPCFSWCRPALLGTLLLCRPAAGARPGVPAAGPAAALVAQAIEQMGGAARWATVHSLYAQGLGHQYLLEQSERPEGPAIPEYVHFARLHDLAHRRQRTRSRTEGFGYAYGSVEIVTDSVVARQAGPRFRPASPDAQDANDLSPERLLFTAAAAPDLRSAPDTLLQGVPHHVVAFTWRQWPVRLLLNAHTGLPTGSEMVRPVRDGHWAVWGDVRLLALYSLWSLDPSGVRYPLQTDFVYNGQLARTALITTLTLNVAAPADSFAVPRPVQQAFQAQLAARPPRVARVGGGPRPAGEIAPGVYSLPGSWDVTLVRQSDGLVVLEAPISSAYSAGVLARARELFPGVPVKAVISTSDAWPHLGGVREYAARHVPVYALDANRPILERLLQAPFRTAPDSLHRAPVRKPALRWVAAKTTLGQGPNRLELYPARTESGERMLLVYFPEHRLLYGSDLVQPNPAGGFTFPEYVAELRARVEALGLPVATVFAMHSSPLAWEKVVQATTPPR